MMKANWTGSILVSCMILLLAACSQIVPSTLSDNTPNGPVTILPGDDPQQSGAETASQTQESETDGLNMNQPTTSPLPSGLEALVEKAKQDLAQRLSVSVDQINLVEAKSVVWPDASLGCPQPDMAYAEVLTSGYLILLNAGNKEYEYHASKGTEVVYCENPVPPVQGTPDDI